MTQESTTNHPTLRGAVLTIWISRTRKPPGGRLLRKSRLRKKQQDWMRRSLLWVIGLIKQDAT